jgi:predicted glycogen debranching enzyme
MKFSRPDFEEVANKEWLITNGLGGYASSTISGANTRRYHGLLVASLRPPTERFVIVSKIEETVINHKGNRFDLSSNQFPGAIHPTGYEFITGFERESFPRTKFKGPGFRLSKTVFMLYHSNTVVIRYENDGKIQSCLS